MSIQTEICIVGDATKLAEAVAELFVAEAIQSVRVRNRFMTAMSGGSTPRPSNQLLASEGFSHRIPWQNTHLFWVDDRCVPEDDPSSNYGAARSDFISMVDIPESQVYPMPTLVEPKIGAAEYEKTVVSTFGAQDGEIPKFDCIFLGIGTDGHTASLFPGQDSLWSRDKLIFAVRGGNPDVERLTMSSSLINQARHVVILVQGQAKAKLVEEIFTIPEEKYPIQLIKPVNGKVSWLLDRQAAQFLPDTYLK